MIEESRNLNMRNYKDEYKRRDEFASSQND
jgi:hypothetical protein